MHYPRAQAWWERFAWFRVRACGVCGVRWPCDESQRDRLRARLAPDWNAVPTAAWPQDGGVDDLTLAQQFRANGGRW